jgi:phenylacetate-CoA ligase
MNHLIDIIFQLKNILFRQKAVSQYKDAMYNCNLPNGELKKLNWEKRKAIVLHAYNNTIFYKKYYDGICFHPDMLRAESDWNKVPTLEKEMLRQYGEEIRDMSVDHRHLRIATTGGSTGIPLKIYTDKRFNVEVLGWRAFKWWNVSPAANIGIIHRRVPATRLKKILNKALWWPTKRIYLQASSISETDLQHFVSALNRKKIVWLQGYVGGLERVAEYILKNRIEITRLKLVWSTSAPISRGVRLKLEKAFNCKIMNQYGCAEVANIAIQCPQEKFLHINYDYVHVDVVDKENNPINEQEGDILVTNLYSYVFPLIKYRLGDKGKLLRHNCSCGVSLPLLEEVKGRISDSVYTPDGLYIDGNYLNSIFDDYVEWIDQFQIYQKMDYSLTIYVKPYSQDDETLHILSIVKRTIERNVRNTIPVTIEIVDRIDDDKGKIRYIISELALSNLQIH